MRSDRSQANRYSWHSTTRSVPDQEHFFVTPWVGTSVTSVPARGPHA